MKMNRRNALKAGVATAATIGSSAALAGSADIQDPLLIRMSGNKDDVGYCPSAVSVGVTLDGIECSGGLIETVDEAGGYAIVFKGAESGCEMVKGNYRITGLTDAQRLAHNDRIRNKNDITVETAMKRLKKCIHEDDEMAWGWHCNLAMASQDEGMSHEDSQKAARRFMGWLFERSDYPSPTGEA